MDDQSWWRETLKVWCQYLAVGLAVIPAANIFAEEYAAGRGAVVPLLISMLIGVGAALFAWSAVEAYFLLREIDHDMREVNERTEADHAQDDTRAPEVDRLKTETRRLLETMRAAA